MVMVNSWSLYLYLYLFPAGNWSKSTVADQVEQGRARQRRKCEISGRRAKLQGDPSLTVQRLFQRESEQNISHFVGLLFC